MEIWRARVNLHNNKKKTKLGLKKCKSKVHRKKFSVNLNLFSKSRNQTTHTATIQPVCNSKKGGKKRVFRKCLSALKYYLLYKEFLGLFENLDCFSVVYC